MEFFREFLFGISGLSLIFWVSVIGIWHADMFPRFFKEDGDGTKGLSSGNEPITDSIHYGSLVAKGALRPSNTLSRGLEDRSIYLRKSFVVANFNALEPEYGVNRLYTMILLSLGVMTFILLTYGFHSALIGITV